MKTAMHFKGIVVASLAAFCFACAAYVSNSYRNSIWGVWSFAGVAGFLVTNMISLALATFYMSSANKTLLNKVVIGCSTLSIVFLFASILSLYPISIS